MRYRLLGNTGPNMTLPRTAGAQPEGLKAPHRGPGSSAGMRWILFAALVALVMAAPPAGAGDRTVIGTISKIDPQAGTFSVTDGMGTRWNYKVHSGADLDLSQFKEGDRVTVTIERATPPTMMSAADYFRKGDRIVKIPY